MAGVFRAVLLFAVLAQLPPHFLLSAPAVLLRNGTYDIHSLCLNFNVKSQSRPGQPWCEVQGSVDKTSFLQYDSESNKIESLGHLGKEVNATKTWTQFTQMLKEMGQDLRMILLDMDLEKNKTRSHLTLQAKIFCQLKGKNLIGSFWNFSIDGQPSLCFNAKYTKWIVINPRARGLKEKWENDKELINHFRKTSMGDCPHWLTEFLEHWKEMPAPTSTAPVINQSPHTPSISVISSKATDLIILAVAIAVAVAIAIIIIMLIRFCKNRTDTMEEAVPLPTISSLDLENATSSDQPLMARSDR